MCKKASKTIEDVFEGYDFETNECVEWEGKLNVCGYAQTWLNGTNNLVHRLSYKQYIGPIENKKEVAHTCHNRKCINPNHLKLLTHQENIKHSYKDKNPRKKRIHLTKIQVDYIQTFHMNTKVDVIMKQYNISRQTVYRIKAFEVKGKK